MLAAFGTPAAGRRRLPYAHSMLPQVPPEILGDVALNAAIAVLPANYNFEMHKTVGCGCLA